jgi:protein SCO1
MLLAVLPGGVVAACGGDTAPADVRGLVREVPLAVGEVVATEVDAEGNERPLPLRAEPGEVLVVYFGYTACPDLCPTTLADLRSARRRLPDDLARRVDLAMVTVDPERDTPSVLVGYLGGFAERFHAVREVDPARLARVQDAFLAASSVTIDAEGDVEVAHTTVTYVVDDRGDVVVEWPFAAGADTMAHDLAIVFDRLDYRGES